MPSILIADDHAIFRRALREFLALELESATFGEAASAEEVLTQTRSRQWDLVILDISMPGRSGLDVLKELSSRQTQPAVLVLSMHAEILYGKRALRAGASGYLSKDSEPEELITAIRRVLRGGTYISAAVAEKLAKDLSHRTEGPEYERLSGRELEILCMIASGKTVSQIADTLHLSVTTVSTYRARILEKLNLRTSAELMRYALNHDLVT